MSMGAESSTYFEHSINVTVQCTRILSLAIPSVFAAFHSEKMNGGVAASHFGHIVLRRFRSTNLKLLCTLFRISIKVAQSVCRSVSLQLPSTVFFIFLQKLLYDNGWYFQSHNRTSHVIQIFRWPKNKGNRNRRSEKNNTELMAEYIPLTYTKQSGCVLGSKWAEREKTEIKRVEMRPRTKR